jgi:hypothetical protein
MSSIEVYIVVEGQTEQTFVREVLAPAMCVKEIYLYPILIGKPGHKGGNIRFDRAKTDIVNFLRQRSNTYVSTMFDYFRIDAEWPGRAEIHQQTLNGATFSVAEKAAILENATLEKILEAFPELNAERRFIPYIEMHEFEALLFSDAVILAQKTGIAVTSITGILERYNDPEAINDQPENAPSKRLETLKTGYRKVAMGKTISEAIGIETIRKQCSHFNDWLTKLENLVVGA